MRLRPLIILLTGALAFSCGKERVERSGDSAEPKISFDTRLTRGATVADPAGLAAAGGFNVWAVSHATKWSTNPAVKTTLLNGTTVTGAVNGSDVTWSYNNPVFWPGNEYVSFFAYGPASAATVNGETTEGIPVIDFPVSTAVRNQKDLLIASPVYDKVGPTYSYGQPVSIFFNHVLSRVVFSGIISDDTDTRSIKIKKIVLNGLYYSGSASLSIPVAWNVDQTGTNSYTLQISTGELKNQVVSTTAAGISSDNGQLFLMPQVLARAAGQDPTMDVTLEIDGVDVNYSSILFSPDEWLPGKSYDYQIVIDGDDLKMIVIDSDISLAVWDVYIMIQPVPLTTSEAKDVARIRSALSSLAYLNAEGNSDLMVRECKYFAIYLRNDVSHDLTIDIADYNNSFTTGESLIFDAESMLDEWGNDGDPVSPVNYTIGVAYDPAVWDLASPTSSLQDKGSIIVVRK